MSRVRLGFLLAASIFALLIASACGDDSEGTGPGDTAPGSTSTANTGAGNTDTETAPELSQCVDHENPGMSLQVELFPVMDRSPQVLPSGIGITPGCIRPLHTHTEFVVSIEYPEEREFTLRRLLRCVGSGRPVLGEGRGQHVGERAGLLLVGGAHPGLRRRGPAGVGAGGRDADRDRLQQPVGTALPLSLAALVLQATFGASKERVHWRWLGPPPPPPPRFPPTRPGLSLGGLHPPGPCWGYPHPPLRCPPIRPLCSLGGWREKEQCRLSPTVDLGWAHPPALGRFFGNWGHIPQAPCQRGDPSGLPMDEGYAAARSVVVPQGEAGGRAALAYGVGSGALFGGGWRRGPCPRRSDGVRPYPNPLSEGEGDTGLAAFLRWVGPPARRRTFFW